MIDFGNKITNALAWITMSVGTFVLFFMVVITIMTIVNGSNPDNGIHELGSICSDGKYNAVYLAGECITLNDNVIVSDEHLRIMLEEAIELRHTYLENIAVGMPPGYGTVLLE